MADVKWEIDVDAKAGKAKEAGSVLERLEKTLQRIDGSTASMAGHFADVGERGRHAGEKVHGVFGDILSERVFEKIAEGAKMVVEKIIDIGEEAIKAASAEQRMMRVFEAQAGSKELGAQNELWTDILSKQTEFNEQQTEGAFLDMKRVGATDQEARLALKAAADIAAVSKNKDEAFGATVEAFARLQRTGVISNRSLAPLGLGVKDFKSLDSMKGLSDKAIKKRMEEGKVDQGDLFKLIMSRTHEKAIGERAANNADLLGTKLAKLTELPDKFFKKLADTTAIKTLTTALDGVLSKLDPESPTGKKISGFLEGAFTAVADAVKEIDFDAVADTLTDDVLPALKTVVSWIKPFVEGVERVVRGFHEMHDIAFGPAAKSSALDDFERRQRDAKRRADEDDAEPAFLKKKAVYVNKWHTVGEAGEAGLAGGFAGGKAEDAATDVAGKMDKAARKRLKVHSPSVVFEDIGAMTAAGFVQGVEGGGADVDRSVQKMFDFGRGGGAIGGQRGDVNVTFATTINLAPGDGTEQGQRAADAFNMKVQAQIISALEQAAIEAGVL